MHVFFFSQKHATKKGTNDTFKWLSLGPQLLLSVKDSTHMRSVQLHCNLKIFCALYSSLKKQYSTKTLYMDNRPCSVFY